MGPIGQRWATIKGIWQGKPPGLAEAQVEAENVAYSVDIVLEEMRRTLTQQQSHISTIDTKASFFLTSASIIVGFAGLRAAGSENPVIGPIWLAIGLVIYFALLFSVVRAYQPRGYASVGLEPSALPLYLFEDPEYTKRQLIATMREVHEQNVKPVQIKTTWLKRSQRIFEVEVGYLVVVLVGHSLSGWLHSAWDTFMDWI